MLKRKTYINEDFDKDDVMDIVKHDKNFEKRVKELTTEVVVDLFRILWQRKSTYENDLKR